MAQSKTAFLYLETGEVFQGESFGYQTEQAGELVFSTGMVGYTESLTDPSFKSQILVLTYPLIGNYGVPGDQIDSQTGLPKYFESNKIHLSGLVVGEVCQDGQWSHWLAKKSLDNLLKDNQVPGISGIDTRALTKIIREHGVLRARIVTSPIDPQVEYQPSFDFSTNDLVSQVTTSEPYDLYSQDYIKNSESQYRQRTVLVIDCGLKYNQLRCLLKHPRTHLRVVPANYDFNQSDVVNTFDRLFISNGPGNPEDCQILIQNLKTFLTNEMKKADPRPVFGICLGHQILALAIGAKTYKMKYGNRGLNLPCVLANTNCSLITSQNHGYAVDGRTLPEGWSTLFVNANDNSNEGLYHQDYPFYSVQFHPEAKPGPEDSEFLFELFLNNQLDKIWSIMTAKGTHIPSYDRFQNRKKVLILGSGGLSIGQSGEFDYSGSQAIKAYNEAGLTTVLINPNIATVQTSPGFADKVYFLPLDPEYVIKVIKVERPDCITLSFGGQTALNCGVKLYQQGIFEKYQIEILGSPIESVIMTEDRDRFKQHLDEIGEPSIESQTANSIEEAQEIAKVIGYPLLVRAAYALGGLGSGFAYNQKELNQLLPKAFAYSDQVIIDKSLRGWKELEYEVVRDASNNCICVCNMENIDPLGIHTGESIVIAPSQTLDDYDYQMLRTSAIKTIRSLNIVGECNIQFALDPKSRQYYIIEVNARLSRSSALASKATGYPLAYVAAKLSLGQSLLEVKNSITKKTTACFEPSLDYCVIKVPRWDLRKFPQVSTELDSSMKSIGEAMAISRSFEEAFQKALRMADESLLGFQPKLISTNDQTLENPTHQRMSVLASALYDDYDLDKLYNLTKIDHWFLAKFKNIIQCTKTIEKYWDDDLPFPILEKSKKLGFSDKQIGHFCQSTEIAIRNQRTSQQLYPKVKQVDTVAAEFPCYTNYLYTTYGSSNEHDVTFDQGTTIILGSGVYKIGSSVEFDWCCVNAVREVRKLGRHATMINCNPETVSTDYDEADKLYFDELSFETVMDIYTLENPKGIILSAGGQVANNMAMSLYRQYVKVIGTSPEVIDTAENRFKFSRLLDKLEIKQPEWKELTSLDEALEFCHQVTYPCLIRPSYVLSGAAMNVCYSDEELLLFLQNAKAVSKDYPVVISKYIVDAKEIEVDAVAHNHEVKVMAISEHVENAGVHSGDSTIILPPQDVTVLTKSRIQMAVKKLVKAIDINGPFNMQFMVKDDQIQVIECNLRVSRTFPFVSKTLNINLVQVAIDVMLEQHQVKVPKKLKTHWVGVKAPKFSFSRLKRADFQLGVEMVSTGEVACYGRTKQEAYLKAIQATDVKLPPTNGGILISLGTFRFKQEFLASVKTLQALGYRLFGTRGTTDFYREHQINITEVIFPRQKSQKDPNSFWNLVNQNQIHLILNVSRLGHNFSTGEQPSKASHYSQGYHIRRTAVDHSIPVIPEIKSAKLLVQALSYFHEQDCEHWVDTEVDCLTTQNIVRLPGLIDVHVHVREPGACWKEDWSTCTKAALAGGITTICAMPNTNPAITDEESLSLVENLAKEKAHCDFGLYVGANSQNTKTVNHLWSRASSLKMYLNNTYGPLLLENTLDWAEHIRHWPTDQRPLCVHAEGQTLTAVLHLANLYQKPIHICHVARREEIEIIKMSKQAGQLITCEVAPHHLFLSENDLKTLKSCGGVKPPLMTLDDQQALWDNLDMIDCFATDHAPHTWKEKCGIALDGSRGPAPPGFPGLETALPLLLTAVKQGRLTLDQIVEKYHTNPKRIFGLSDISTDPESTYIEVDLDKRWTIPEKTTYCKAGWTPFAGLEVQGMVKRVVLRNKVVYVDGEVLAPAGYGRKIDQLVTENSPLEISSIGRESPETNQLSEPNFRPHPSSLSNIKHIISVEQFTKDHLGTLFDIADHLRYLKNQGDDSLSRMLKNKVLGLIFYEASTRTKCSFSAAMKRLGGKVIEIEASQSSTQKGESFSDFVKCIECYTDAIVVRNSQSGSLVPLTQSSKVPIISAGDGTGEHPTQALLDAYTIRKERGTINGLTVALVGDLKHGRTVHSLAKLLSLYNVQLRYISPPGLEMPGEVQDYVRQRNVSQSTHQSLEEVLPEIDILYMTRIQAERFQISPELATQLENYQLSPKNLTHAKDNLVIMHPLPRVNEISPEIDNDPRAAYFRQMKNGMYIRMALLSVLLS